MRTTPFGYETISVSTNIEGLKKKHYLYLFTVVSPASHRLKPFHVFFHECGEIQFLHPDAPFFYPDSMYSFWMRQEDFDKGIFTLCPSPMLNAGRWEYIVETIPPEEEIKSLFAKRANELNRYPEVEAQFRAGIRDSCTSDLYSNMVQLLQLNGEARAAITRVHRNRDKAGKQKQAPDDG